VKTNDFIRALAADREVAIRPGWAFALALAAGFVVAAAVFMATLGFRSDLMAALHTGRFVFKFVVTIALFAAGLHVASELARPGGDAARAVRLLLAPVLLLADALAI
jgi:hypothetical protein